ncbi:Protein kinase domain-containing protein [Mycena venus]|uniref:Protein kinase domain-containing protein n=1 Tax=Mycena venus TaxID=2733690 RepID=A0A8H7CTM9_9AGAR|nr:Protein kinase domain-containing protein [Mycena venus]
MSARYREHVDRHHLTILDGRVTLNLNEPVNMDGHYSDVHKGSLQSLQADFPPAAVAVKMIRGRSIADSDIRKFLKEVHTWSKLDYTNNNHILPLFGITLDLGGTLSIISPWMGQGSAIKYVSNETIHPGPLLHDVATALHYLHARKETVYHGDVKGDNIMVSDSGQAFLADFGFSVLASGSFSLSITHPTGGTPLWMAPEKLRGEGDSAAADVYSFAMLILELFTRKEPFKGEIRPNVDQIQNGRRPVRPNPDVTLNRLTDDWWKLCELYWAPDPCKRWTMEQIKETIGQNMFHTTANSMQLNIQMAGGSTIETEITNGPINLCFVRDLSVGHLYGSQILLRLYPAEPVSDVSLPVAWKILTFDDDTAEKTITWTADFGFCTIDEQEDGSIVPESATVVQLGQVSRLVWEAGKLQWSSPENGNAHHRGAALNQSNMPVSLALCLVDSVGTYTPKYSPVVRLGLLQHGATFSSGAPVKLQAYVVSGNKVYKEGQVIEKQDLLFPLFSNFEGLPEPHDFRSLPKYAKFSVSKQSSGKLVVAHI